MAILSEVDHADEGVKREELRDDKAEEVNSSLNKENKELALQDKSANYEGGPVDNENTAMDLTASKVKDSSMFGGLDKAGGSGKKEIAVNEKKVDAMNSSSSKVTKKIVRKRKKNAEESPLSAVSTPPMVMKKDSNAVKESPPCDSGNRIENNKTENEAKQQLVESADTVGDVKRDGGGKKDVELGKKVEGAIKITKTVKRKKIVGKEKIESPNSETVTAKSAPVEAPATILEETSIETNITPVAEKVDIEAIKEDADEAEKEKVVLNRRPGLKKRKKVAVSSKSLTGADNPSSADKPSSSAKEKDSEKDVVAEKKLKKVDGMGLIFMCNAKTKKDCYRYNILGLPESKKELVSKVYKGMRLFLFDVDLKLMYGIYKAAGPGGYNIQPKAFDSKFPSQVRFTVLKDCLPLPEEKFKAAIKDNYFKRHKFNCQLSSEQVKKLCNLFQSTSGKAPKHNRHGGADRDATEPSSRSLELKRRLPRNKYSGRLRNDAIYTRERYLSPRVRYPSPLQLPVARRALPPPLSPTYAYERPAGAYYVRDRRGLDMEMRPVDPPIDYQDPYFVYGEIAPYAEPHFAPSLPSAYAARFHPPSPPRYRY